MSENPSYEELLERVRQLEQADVLRDQAEKALIKSEERFRLLYKNAPLSYQSLDENGCFVEVNQAWLDSLGYTRDEIIGKSFSELLHPDWQDHFRENFPRFKAIGEVLGVEFEMVKKDGTLILVSFTGKIGKDRDGHFQQTHCIFDDITNRRKADIALRKSEARFRTLFEQAAVGVAQIESRTGRFILINKRYCDIVGYTSDEMTQLNFHQITHPDDLKKDLDNMHQLLSNDIREFSIEKRYYRKDGTIVWVFLTVSPLWEIGQEPDYHIAVVQDISDRKKAEAALGRIEWMLSKGPGSDASYRPPRSDLTQFNHCRLILDAVGEEMLTNIVGDYLDLLETSAAVYESNGDYALGIFSSGWCQFMDRASRKLCHTADHRKAMACGKWHCHESCWNQASKTAMDRNKPIEIECHGGIHIYAVPIRAGNQIVGAINFGYGDPPTDLDMQQALAQKYGVTIEELTTLATAYETRPPYIINLAKRRLAVSARLIGEIVERRQTQQALQKSEEKYRRIFENSVVGLFESTPAGRFVSVNSAFAKMLRYDSPDEFISSTDDHANRFYVNKHDRIRYHQLLQQKGKVDGFEFKVRCKDKSEIWVTTSTRAYFDKEGKVVHYDGVISDISARIEAVQSLKESEQRFRELFDNMSSGVAIYESPDDGRTFILKDLNRSGLAKIKKTKKQVIGRDIREVFPQVAASGLLNVFQRVWQTNIPQHVPSNRYKNSVLEFWLENYVCRLPSGEMVAIYEDITERVRAEQTRKELEKQIQQAQKMESIGNLAGGIAHDFNNILSAIIGFTELSIDDAEKGTAMEDNLQEIFAAGQRAKELVKQILTFARQSNEEVKPLKINLIAKEVLKFIRSTIPTTIQIEQNIVSKSLILANPTQVHQVLMNLCTNAAHAMEDKGGVLSLSLSDVKIDGSTAIKTPGLKPGNYIELKVADTGSGIPLDMIESIFEPYSTTKPPGKGTGMGLAVVHGIIQSYGGTISTKSILNAGTVFTIYIPATDQKESLRQYESEKIPSGTESILFVDDEDPIGRMASRILQRLGYKVTVCRSGTAAIEEFRLHPSRYDLVLTDMTMPKMTGDKLAVAVMKIRPDIPIILCTGYSNTISEQKASLLGIRAFVYKPIVREELAKTIRKVLDDAEKKRAR